MELYKYRKGNEYLFQLYRAADYSPKTYPKVPNALECTCLYWSAWKDCNSNGGTRGRATDLNTCLEYYFSPKRGTEIIADIVVSERGLGTKAAL